MGCTSAGCATDGWPWTSIRLTGGSQKTVRGIHPLIACSPPNVTIHNPEFAAYARGESGDRAAIDGAKALAMTALDFLEQPALRETVVTEFEEIAAG